MHAEGRFVADGVRVPHGFLLDYGADERGIERVIFGSGAGELEQFSGGHECEEVSGDTRATNRMLARITQRKWKGLQVVCYVRAEALTHKNVNECYFRREALIHRSVNECYFR